MKKQITIYFEDSDYHTMIKDVAGHVTTALHFGWGWGAQNGEHENGEFYGYEFQIADWNGFIEGSPEREDEKWEEGII